MNGIPTPGATHLRGPALNAAKGALHLNRWLLACLLLAVMAAPRFPAGGAAAREDSTIHWWAVAAGGGPSTGGDVALDATLGQAVVDLASGGEVSLAAGYWHIGMGAGWVRLTAYAAAPLRAFMRLTWETGTEIDNLGFNLYRADSPTGLRTKLNEALIASLVPPGSFGGAAYEWVDQTVGPDRMYFYWLEEVSLYGQVATEGPVRARTNPAGIGPKGP